MKKIVLLLAVMLTLTACKGDGDKGTNTATAGVNKEAKTLKVFLEFKTNAEDEFKIILNNIKIDEFQTKNIQVNEYVKSQTGFDNLLADFGEDNFSLNLILNLGNKVPKEVVLKSIKITYGTQMIYVTDPKEFDKYFIFNKFIERDEASNVLKTKKIDGKLNPLIIVRNYHMNLLEKSL